jgi:pyridoxal phosphate enzyme (YggS family)
MSRIVVEIERLKSCIPDRVKLVAVSKFQPVESILEAYCAGQRAFGESRAQELKDKQERLPRDIEWHFIGPLQSNKVKDIAPFVHTIHSVDSLKLLREIDKQAARWERVIRVLFEIHIAREAGKHGFLVDGIKALLDEVDPEDFGHVRFCGLMGMATFTEDEQQIRREFRLLNELFRELRLDYFPESDDFVHLSMGMTGDYGIAIEEGSTIVRIGTQIFAPGKTS